MLSVIGFQSGVVAHDVNLYLTDMAIVVFVDTNFFLQVKEISTLRWTDICDETEIYVLVPRAVQREIDRLKRDGSGRRSQRARNASSLLRKVILAEGEVLIVRESNPRVLVGFPPISTFDKLGTSTLDPSFADDQIVGEVLDYIGAYPSKKVVLLTDDTGPMLTAKRHVVPFWQIPGDWLLAPEPDARDKTIKELTKRLGLVERSHPVAEISAWKQDHSITEVTVEIATFQPLSEQIIDQLIAEIRDRCPMAEEFGLSGTALLQQQTIAVALGRGQRYLPPTEDHCCPGQVYSPRFPQSNLLIH